jgi:hypothetical protein
LNTGTEADVGRPRKQRRSPDEPSDEERRAIEYRIRLLPLMRRDAPGVLDWAGMAGRLAAELRMLARRLGDDQGATDADRERIERAEVVLRDYQTAAAEAASTR